MYSNFAWYNTVDFRSNIIITLRVRIHILAYYTRFSAMIIDMIVFYASTLQQHSNQSGNFNEMRLELPLLNVSI